MKILSFCFLLCGVAHATSWAPLDFPVGPTSAQLLENNGLGGADEEVLLRYLETRWDKAGFWIPDIPAGEQEKISREYFRRVELKGGDAATYLKAALSQLQIDRLMDQRRVVDAAIRELGRKGTGKSLLPLLGYASVEEREWVCWKALASVQEILSREDPGKLDDRTIHFIPADLVAPLLRDLDPGVAGGWAWSLWERQKAFYGEGTFRSKVRLRTRIWLASAFAASHPQKAVEVFREGLLSQDAAIRAATEMTIRSGIGGSLPYSMSAEQLSQILLTGKWNPVTSIWDALPLPLERPLLRKLGGGRRDLIWLSSDARVTRSIDDVWPLIREPLGSGHFYSRIGDYFPMDYGLSDSEGVLYSRVRNLYSTPTLASHGGLWTLSGYNRAAEFHADGSLLWECPLRDGYRMIAPARGGRVVLLGYQFIECRDRRGDLLWRTKLTLDDPRHIIPVDDDRFLLSCGKSIGWLTRDGKYEPVLSGFKSALSILYHPDKPWIIMDGGDTTAVIYDPNSKRETGRVDLDDGWGNGKSRFPFPLGGFPD